jgi:short-subunit dehydrogenase involved in D-alanine esterification of teichoic acids
MSLKDKRIVFIGGSAGISLAAAKEAAVRGARVVIAGRTRERQIGILFLMGSGFATGTVLAIDGGYRFT